MLQPIDRYSDEESWMTSVLYSHYHHLPHHRARSQEFVSSSIEDQPLGTGFTALKEI
jgi:hemerythrin